MIHTLYLFYKGKVVKKKKKLKEERCDMTIIHTLINIRDLILLISKEMERTHSPRLITGASQRHCYERKVWFVKLRDCKAKGHR